MFENSTGSPKEYSKGICIGLKEYSESSIMGLWEYYWVVVWVLTNVGPLEWSRVSTMSPYECY